ncbi:hypothetical protein OF83DRAFT_1167294 [Amylostereum chailletii]|nr:hypothetical protein OF83DRAFT_1167294 [Amylostereum chailletii]
MTVHGNHLRRRGGHRARQFAGGGDGPKFPSQSTTTDSASSPFFPFPAPASSTAPVVQTVQSVQSSSSSAAPAVTPTSQTTPQTSATPTSTSASATSTTPSSTLPTATSTTSVSIASASTPSSSSTPAVAVTRNPTSTQIIIQSEAATLAQASASATQSSTSSSDSGGTSSGIIIGGVVAAIIAAIGIIGAIVYFMRKCRRNEEDPLNEVWSANDARRQSVMLEADAEPASMFDPGRGNRANHLRPPTMIERHVNNASPALAHQRSLGGPYETNPYGYPVAAGYGQPATFGPGDAIFNPPSPDFYSPYSQQPMGSPISSTVPSYHTSMDYGMPMPPQGAITRQPSSGQSLARQASMGNGQQFNGSMDDDQHYADLSRSSVTPFQAAQYEEISRKLGSPAPVLGGVPEEPISPPPTALTSGMHVPSNTGHSPFSDPEDALPSPYVVSPHTRVESLPPVLPEINMHEQPMSPATNEFPASVNSHASHIQSNFAQSRDLKDQSKRPDTVYSTMYDDDDAYGGF